jgi:hypothetical protein
MTDKKPTSKTMLSYFDKITKTLIQSSDLSSTLSHSVSKGTARELLIQDFLQKILPDNINLCSGQIFNVNDNFSGQIDIILSPKTHPKLQISENIAIFPIESVIGAIEVKSKLTTGNNDEDGLSKCLDSCKKLSDLSMENLMRGKHSTLSSYSIFAYDGPFINTIFEKIDDFAVKNKCKYFNKDLPDVIIVLKHGFMLKKYDKALHLSRTWQGANKSYETLNKKDDILFEYFKYLINLINEAYESSNKISFQGYEKAYIKAKELPI